MSTDIRTALLAFQGHTGADVSGSDNPLKLESSLSQPAESEEVEQAWPGQELPQSLMEAWSVSRDSLLFEDVEYGQWGLHLLAPSDSAARTVEQRELRGADYLQGDVVVGEFLGDLDVLVLSGEDVLVALPLDPRPEWPVAANSLAEFLERYLAVDGEKFWE